MNKSTIDEIYNNTLDNIYLITQEIERIKKSNCELQNLKIIKLKTWLTNLNKIEDSINHSKNLIK